MDSSGSHGNKETLFVIVIIAQIYYFVEVSLYFIRRSTLPDISASLTLALLSFATSHVHRNVTYI